MPFVDDIGLSEGQGFVDDVGLKPSQKVAKKAKGDSRIGEFAKEAFRPLTKISPTFWKELREGAENVISAATQPGQPEMTGESVGRGLESTGQAIRGLSQILFSPAEALIQSIIKEPLRPIIGETLSETAGLAPYFFTPGMFLRKAMTPEGLKITQKLGIKPEELQAIISEASERRGMKVPESLRELREAPPSRFALPEGQISMRPLQEFLTPPKTPVTKIKPTQKDMFGVAGEMPIKGGIPSKEVGEIPLETATKEAVERTFIKKHQLNIPSQPQNIITWIRSKGGIDYQKEFWNGELDIAVENQPSLRYALNKRSGKGQTLDELAMQAQSEGWIKEATPQALLDAITKKKIHPSIIENRISRGISPEGGFLEIPSREEIRRFGGKVKSHFKEFWQPLSTIPQSEQYKTLRYKTLGELDRVERLTTNLWQRLKVLPEQNRKDIFKFMNGEIPLTDLPNDIRPIAQSTRTAFDIAGKRLVKRGLLPEKTFEANKKEYVPYLYLKHVLGEKVPLKMTPGGKLDFSYLKARKDLTPEQRKAIGLIEDISISGPVGLAREFSDIAKFDRLSKIAENPEWTWTPSVVKVGQQKMGIGKLVEEVKTAEEMHQTAPNAPEIKARLDTLKSALNQAMEATGNVPEGFTQLPTTKTYGPLAGAYVRTPIAKDIMPVADIPTRFDSKAIQNIVNAERKMMGAFKVGKVALNVPTITRNTVSNVIQLNMSGIPIQDVPKYMAKAAEAMQREDTVYRQAVRNGIFKTNWAQGEIREVLDTIRQMDTGKLADIQAGIMKLAKFYGKIDDFFKMTKFIEQIERGADFSKATLEAQKWVMDYSLADPTIKWARRHIMPFVTYQYKIAPLIAEAAVKRPWVFAKYVALPYLAAEGAKTAFDMTEEEWRQLKAKLPLFVKKNRTLVPLWYKSPEGNVQWFDYQYFLPWQNYYSLTQIEGPKDIAEGVGIGNPILDVYSAFTSARGDTPPKDPYTGRDIYNKLDPPGIKAQKSVEWIYNKWAPTMLTRYGTLGKTLRIGEKDRYGRTITPEQGMASLFGVNIISPTEKQAKMEKGYRMKDAERSLIKILSDPTISKEEKARARQYFKDYIEDIKKDYE